MRTPQTRDPSSRDERVWPPSCRLATRSMRTQAFADLAEYRSSKPDFAPLQPVPPIDRTGLTTAVSGSTGAVSASSGEVDSQLHGCLSALLAFAERKGWLPQTSLVTSSCSASRHVSRSGFWSPGEVCALVADATAYGPYRKDRPCLATRAAVRRREVPFYGRAVESRGYYDERNDRSAAERAGSAR